MTPHLFLGALVLGAVVVSSGTAAAEDAPAVEKMVELNRAAIARLKDGKAAAAREGLVGAVVMGKEAGLGTHQMMARTYLHLGAAYLALEERDKAVRHLVLALKIRPDIQITSAVVSPAMQEAYAAARAQLGLAPVPTPAVPAPASAPSEAKKAEPAATKAKDEPLQPEVPEEPDLPASVPSPVHCPLPDEAPPETEITVRCVPGPDLRFMSMVLSYRAGGERFTEVRMSATKKGWYVGVIPGNAVVGKSLQYFVEARAGSKIMHATGRSDSPSFLIVRAGAAPVGHGVLSALRTESDDNAGPAKDDDPLHALRAHLDRAQVEVRIHRRATKTFFVGLGIGTGYGWHLQSDLEFHTPNVVNAGFSPGTLVNVTPEIGYQWDEHLAFSLQSRHQYIPSSSQGDSLPGKPPQMAHAVFARAYYFWRTWANWQLYGTGTLGGGNAFRLHIPKKPPVLAGDDTIVGGPIALGPGVGMTFHQTRRVAFTAEARMLVGVWKVAAVMDLNLGAVYAF